MILKNAKILENEKLVKKDILILDGKILKIEDEIKGLDVIDCKGFFLTPSFIDLHVHFREPGFTNKETIKTGSHAAAKGGFTTVFAMPNLNPVPDNLEHLNKELEIIKKDAVINVIPYGSVSKNEASKELSDIIGMMKLTKFFTDDGKGVNNLKLLKEAMEIAKENNLIIASHAEDDFYKTSPEGEYVAVRREIELAKEVGCRYHFCHMSTKESFEAIKEAQKEGYPITCEVTPHHLFLNNDMILGNPNFKMNPPLRSEEDRIATVNALLEGVAIAVASDHAPHSVEEKKVPYDKAPNGIIGLETMVPLVYTNLVKTKKAKLQDLNLWFNLGPAKAFGIKPNMLKVGEDANLTLLDLENPHLYIEDEILSIGKNSPFIGSTLYGISVLTIYNGNIVYKK